MHGLVAKIVPLVCPMAWSWELDPPPDPRIFVGSLITNTNDTLLTIGLNGIILGTLLVVSLLALLLLPTLIPLGDLGALMPAGDYGGMQYSDSSYSSYARY